MRALAILLALVFLFAPSALAQEGALTVQEGALTAEALYSWRDEIWKVMRTLPVMNQPSETNDPDLEDTWLFAFDFGVAALSEPNLETDENPVLEVEILSEGMRDPRGLTVGATVKQVLAAYPNDNRFLIGDANYATLYLNEGETEDSAHSWGWMLRRNQVVDGIEYTVSVPAELSGFRQMLTVLYVIEEDVVTSIRVGGFDSLVSQADSLADLQSVQAIAQKDQYVPGTGGDTATFAAYDLTFGEISFQTATAEDCIQQLGTPVHDDIDETGGARTLTYGNALIECEKAGGHWQVRAVLVSGGGLAGPRNLHVGDSMQSVLERFGTGEDEGTYVYTCTDILGQTYALVCTFFDDILTEYLLYRI